MPYIKNQQNAPQKKSFFELVPKAPLVEVIPYIHSARMNQFLSLLSEKTRSQYQPPFISMTPGQQHIESAISNSGSKLVQYSPFRSLAVEKTNAEGQIEKEQIFFLIREKDRKEKVSSPLLEYLAANATPAAPVEKAVTVTAETRGTQPKRSTITSQKTAVGNRSAKDILVKYFQQNFEELGITNNSADIKALNLNLCHVLSVGLANKAIMSTGGVFNTQIRDNIFAGSRALNVSMFPIENSLLDFIQRNEVVEIEYMGVCTPYEEVHAVHSLVLHVKMRTHSNSLVEFKQEFQPEETRMVSREVTTAVHAFLSTMCSSPASSRNSLSDSVVLPKDAVTKKLFETPRRKSHGEESDCEKEDHSLTLFVRDKSIHILDGSAFSPLCFSGYQRAGRSERARAVSPDRANREPLYAAAAAAQQASDFQKKETVQARGEFSTCFFAKKQASRSMLDVDQFVPGQGPRRIRGDE